MGILNVTPDSFYDGGRYTSDAEILRQVEKMLTEGADIIDVGGYSSRPGAAEVSVEDETARVLNAIQTILKHFPLTVISIDTFRSKVAEAAVGAGAVIINDISAGDLDPEMFKMAARLKVPYILMHMRGNPQTMTGLTHYENLVSDILEYFHKKIAELSGLGVKDIIIDPGFGFAKTREQNFVLLNRLEDFRIFNKPVMAGLSRKSMVWKTLDIKPEEALNGTSALHAIALMKGVDILRVHDIKACVEVVALTNALKRSTT